jgi:3-hydroxyacyl-[acyl-carrier-protein] dehydratase
MRDYGEIRSVLPHGPQMVLVDRVEWLEPGQALRAIKAVTGSEPCYEHLPPGLPRERYAYPASLIIESFGQAAVVLWASKPGALDLAQKVLMFAAARDCRLEGQAFPGDVLRHEVRFERSIADSGFATGETWAGDRRIATMGSVIAVVRPISLLPAAAGR